MVLLFCQLWAQKAGFVVANDLGDFNDNYELRIILADKISSSHDVRANLPNKREITGKIISYFLYCVILQNCMFFSLKQNFIYDLYLQYYTLIQNK